MTLITAKGKVNGREFTVHCKMIDGEVCTLFNRQEHPLLEQRFRDELEKRYPVAGTFYPEVESLTNALEVLRYHFFDDEPEITVDGVIKETIPYKPGRIY